MKRRNRFFVLRKVINCRISLRALRNLRETQKILRKFKVTDNNYRTELCHRIKHIVN